MHTTVNIIFAFILPLILASCQDTANSINDDGTTAFSSERYNIDGSTDELARYYSVLLRVNLDSQLQTYLNSEIDVTELPLAFNSGRNDTVSEMKDRVYDIYQSLLKNFIMECRLKLPDNKSSNRFNDDRYDLYEFGPLTAEEQNEIDNLATDFQDSLKLHLGQEIYDDIMALQVEVWQELYRTDSRFQSNNLIVLHPRF